MLRALLIISVVALTGCEDSRCAQVRDQCDLSDRDSCGPTTATVKRVVDGDTVELEGGEKVRYIGVDTPEKGKNGYDEATAFNRSMVEGQEVELVYDVDCRDRYSRLLAYVCVDLEMVNEQLLRQGHARTLPIKPNTCNKEEFSRIEDGL